MARGVYERRPGRTNTHRAARVVLSCGHAPLFDPPKPRRSDVVWCDWCGRYQPVTAKRQEAAG